MHRLTKRSCCFLATNVCWVIHCKTSVLRGAGGVVANTFETGARQTRRTFVSHLTTSRTSRHRAYPEWFYPLVEDKPFLTFGMPRDVFISMAGAAEFTLGFGLEMLLRAPQLLGLDHPRSNVEAARGRNSLFSDLARIPQARGPSGQFDLGRDALSAETVGAEGCKHRVRIAGGDFFGKQFADDQSKRGAAVAKGDVKTGDGLD